MGDSKQDNQGAGTEEIHVPDENGNDKGNLDYDSLLDKLNEAEELVKKSEEQVLRFRADMENIRRRAQNDISKAHKYGLEKFATALLPSLDSLDQGMRAANIEDPQQKAMHEGIALTMKMFEDTFSQFNIVTVAPVQGDAYDSQVHEAMSTLATNEVAPDLIVDCVQKGYLLADRLLRPARVIVAKAKD